MLPRKIVFFVPLLLQAGTAWSVDSFSAHQWLQEFSMRRNADEVHSASITYVRKYRLPKSDCWISAKTEIIDDGYRFSRTTSYVVNYPELCPTDVSRNVVYHKTSFDGSKVVQTSLYPGMNRYPGPPPESLISHIVHLHPPLSTQIVNITSPTNAEGLRAYVFGSLESFLTNGFLYIRRSAIPSGLNIISSSTSACKTGETLVHALVGDSSGTPLMTVAFDPELAGATRFARLIKDDRTEFSYYYIWYDWTLANGYIFPKITRIYSDTHGIPDMLNEITILEMTLNPTDLRDDLFTLEIPEGARIQDSRFSPPLINGEIPDIDPDMEFTVWRGGKGPNLIRARDLYPKQFFETGMPVPVE